MPGERRTPTELTITGIEALRLGLFASVAVYVRVSEPVSCRSRSEASNWPAASVGIDEMKVLSRLRFALFDAVNPAPMK